MEETGAHLISYQLDSECFLNLELTFDQTNPKIGPTPPQIHLEKSCNVLEFSKPNSMEL
jgi:hypothetical protein